MNRLNAPTEINTAGGGSCDCVVWLDGADISTLKQLSGGTVNVTTDNDRVGYWGDKSGASRHFTNFLFNDNVRPVYTQSVSGVRFIRTSSNVLSVYLPSALTFTQCTTFAVISYDPGNLTQGGMFTWAGTGDSDDVYSPLNTSSANNTSIGSVVNNSISVISPLTPTLSSFFIFTSRHTGSSLTNFSNSNPSNTDSSTNIGAGYGVRAMRLGVGIGNGITGSTKDQYSSFRVCEIIVFNGQLTTTEYTRVNNYLTRKWIPVFSNTSIQRQVFALKPGLWSDTEIWSTSAYDFPYNYPLSGDRVYTNNFAVTADISTRALNINNTSLLPNINSGGTYTLINNVSLSANIINVNTNGTLLSCTANNYSELIGTASGITNLTQTTRCIDHVGTGTLLISGGTFDVGSNTQGPFLRNNSSGKVRLVCTRFDCAANGLTTYGIQNNSNGIIEIVGNIGGGFAGYNSIISNTSTGSIYISGDILHNGGVANSSGQVLNSGTGRLFISNSAVSEFGIAVTNGECFIDNCILSNSRPVTNSGRLAAITVTGGRLTVTNSKVLATDFTKYAINSTSTNPVSVFGSIENSPRGVQAIYATRYQVFPTSSSTYTKHAVNGYDKFVYYYSQNTVFVPPLSSDVLQGVTYNFGALTGTMALPAITAVNAGVKVGNQIGSAYLSVSDFWNEPLSAIQINSNTIGEYMKKTLTVNSLSSVLNSLDFSKL